MIKYLKSRQCPRCRSIVTLMMLRFVPGLTTINGVCGGCQYSIRWQSLSGRKGLRRSDTVIARNASHQMRGVQP
jgi:hypothetical protein